MELSRGVGWPIATALLLGILGSTSPCQLTTNASALAVISRRLGDPRYTALAALAYLSGKVLVYLFIGGGALILGLGLARTSIPMVTFIRKLLGPLMIFLGLVMLRVIRLDFAMGQGVGNWVERRAEGGLLGSFLLGGAFALAFCPTLFWLFFGLLIPMSLASGVGWVYPAFFALGTTLPLLGLVGILTFGASRVQDYFKGARGVESFLRRATAVILILAGINDTATYWLIP